MTNLGSNKKLKLIKIVDLEKNINCKVSHLLILVNIIWLYRILPDSGIIFFCLILIKDVYHYLFLDFDGSNDMVALFTNKD